ncbi:MAG: MlaD family protein [Solirubrobacteraceae bacterium]
MVRSRKRAAAPLALGLAGLALLAVLLFGGAASYPVNAVFRQVYGLVPGAQVEAGGITVGQVDSISLGADGMPRVRMSIDDGFRLRAGAKANLRAYSLAGEDNRFISLTNGPGVNLPDGSTLGLGSTDRPVEIYQVLSTLDPATRAAVRDTLGGLDASVLGRGNDISAALAHSAAALGNTAALVAEVDSDGQALRTFVHQGSQLVATLARDPAALGATADQLAAVLDTTARRQADLAQTASGLAAGLHSPRLAFAHLDRSIGTLRRLVSEAQPGVRELVPFSASLEPVLLSAPPALAGADALVRTVPLDVPPLTRLAQTLRGLLPTLDRALTSANPILDQLRVRLPDLFSFFANWADFTSDYDANGHAARVGLVFPPASTKPVSGCSVAAGSLAFPFMRAPGILGGQPWTDYASSFIGGGARSGSAGAC